MTSKIRTRHAPSPTGYLHLGHVLHMLWLYRIANELGAEILLRMEDHDQTRCKPEYENEIIEDIRWLETALPSVSHSSILTWRQSQRQARYQQVYQTLHKTGFVYACSCSRQDIANATGQSSGELHYPGTCLYKNIPVDTPQTCLRLKMPNMIQTATDFKHGLIAQNPALSGGDVVIRDKAGNWTYQFCVVIDDFDQDINLIVRGDDLFSSVGRQLAIRRLLLEHLHRVSGAKNSPETNQIYFIHHPLLLNEQGNKLSKRDLADSIASLRKNGVKPADIIRNICDEDLLPSDDTINSSRQAFAQFQT